MCLARFMQSDPWWSFAMAVNVFLVFFFGANPSSFRKHVWIYCVVCFGAPAIPAIACLLIKTDNGNGRIYGDATVRQFLHEPLVSALIRPNMPNFCGL